MLFDFKLVNVVNSCYYWHKSQATKTGVAVRIVFEVVRYCTTKAHHRDLNLSAFVFAVESCNAFFKAVEKHFWSKVLAETKLGVFEELQGCLQEPSSSCCERYISGVRSKIFLLSYLLYY